MSTIEAQATELAQLRGLQVKQAQAAEEDQVALRKAAKALYESDFLVSSEEMAEFVKKAQSSPKFLASTLSRVCAATDVSFLGKRASVRGASEHADDPVYVRAFGFTSGSSLIEDEE